MRVGDTVVDSTVLARFGLKSCRKATILSINRPLAKAYIKWHESELDGIEYEEWEWAEHLTVV